MRATSKLVITVDMGNGNGPYTTTRQIIDWNPMLAREEELSGEEFTSATEVADYIEDGFLAMIGVEPDDKD